jgi:transposase-like protein
MRRYSEAVRPDARRQMRPRHRQSVDQISAELGIQMDTLYNWRNTWRLQGEVVPSLEKDPDGWGANELPHYWHASARAFCGAVPYSSRVSIPVISHLMT